MNKCYLGVDVGSVSTKGVIIDEYNNILSEAYIETNGSPITAITTLLRILKSNFNQELYQIVSVGTTGSARRLIGTILKANTVKNEITAHAIGTLSMYPDTKTILEIGGQDSKIILIEDGIVTDYAMNTLCAAGCGAFLSSQARRLNIPVEEFGNIALSSTNPTKIAARCTVFAESDLVHKAGTGHKKEDIVAGLCESIVRNYLNNVAKGKKITAPIIFQGGVSKNIGVQKAFEKYLGETVKVSQYGHLMGALGVAILARKEKKENLFSFDVLDIKFETRSIECNKCPNGCEIICVKSNNSLLDAWGNKCDNGLSNLKTVN